jgi:hypothetical protein
MKDTLLISSGKRPVQVSYHRGGDHAYSTGHGILSSGIRPPLLIGSLVHYLFLLSFVVSLLLI